MSAIGEWREAAVGNPRVYYWVGNRVALAVAQAQTGWRWRYAMDSGRPIMWDSAVYPAKEEAQAVAIATLRMEGVL